MLNVLFFRFPWGEGGGGGGGAGTYLTIKCLPLSPYKVSSDRFSVILEVYNETLVG